MPKFKSVSGGHVRIFRPDGPLLDIDEGGTYDTDDKDEIQALRDSPEVQEADNGEQSQESEAEQAKAPESRKPERTRKRA